MSNWNRPYCTSPCGTCEKKGCGAYHDKCEAYKAWRAEREAKKAREKLENETRTTAGYHRKRRAK